MIHITDGESTDGDPSNAMKSLTALSSSDGSVLLFNIHLSSDGTAKPVAFPDTAAYFPNQYAHVLFENASHLTSNMRAAANSQHGMNLSDGARGYVFNWGYGFGNPGARHRHTAQQFALNGFRRCKVSTSTASTLRKPETLYPSTRNASWTPATTAGLRGESVRIAIADGATDAVYSALWARLLVKGRMTGETAQHHLTQAARVWAGWWVAAPCLGTRKRKRVAEPPRRSLGLS